MYRLGTPPQPKHYFLKILEMWENGEATIACIYEDDSPISVAFLVSFGTIIENCWASTLREYNKYFVNYLLYSEIIKYSYKKNYKVFSFGRSSLNSGTLRFKQHWRPTLMPVYRNFSSPINKNLSMLRGNGVLHKVYKFVSPKFLNDSLGYMLTKYLY